MKKCKVGVIGIGRGSMMFRYCKDADNAELVAICDKWEEGLLRVKENLNDERIAFYTDFEEFLKHDMDVVLLANYATEHAPFAIKAMEAGKNVISEVLPVQTMAQAVALIECIERTGKIYCYAENYCYMNAPREMKRLYREGKLGEFEYGEGEYLHNCEPIWPDITRGERDHWRNAISAFYYCTHSAGPLLHITGMRPVKVTGFECPYNARMARMGARAGHTAIEMITLENGAVLKSIHGLGCSKNSIWYTIYGSKGRIESAREDAEQSDVSRVYTNLDEVEGVCENRVETYIPETSEVAKKHGHSGSDYFCLHNAIDYIMGDQNADVIDVYEAVNMWMCGFFGYQSVLNGGDSMEIPDLHDPAVREQYRNDHRCTDPKVGGEDTQPSYSKGNPEVSDEIYAVHQKRWEEKNRPQLVMHWKNNGEPAPEIKLPLNCSIVAFPQLKDAVNKWLDIMQYGLTNGVQKPEFYEQVMVKHPHYEDDKCFFLLENGEAVASITVICDYEKQEGYIHMVACKEAYRGKGYGTLLNQIAEVTLKKEGMQTAYLTTDDWRIPAIKSYLRAGFEPDVSTEGFKERWEKIYKKI